MSDPARDDGGLIRRGPYRSSRVAAPRRDRRRALLGGALAAIVALAASRLTAARWIDRHPAAPPAGPPRGAPPGSPVVGASLLVGGERVCALARSPAGHHEVVCRPVDTETQRGEERDAARAWRSEALVHLAVAQGLRERSDTLVATGVQPDGRVVTFSRSSDHAVDAALDAPGGHRRVVEAYHLAGGYTVGSGCESETFPWAQWVVRMEDGAWFASGWDGWIPVLDAGDYVPGSVRVDTAIHYVRARDGRAVTGWRPWPHNNPQSGSAEIDLNRAPPRPVAALTDVRAAELAPFGTRYCALDAGGAIRCAPAPGAPPEARAETVRGPVGGAVALASGAHDLCARARDGAWWCARGPDEDDVEAPGEGAVTLRPEPELRGARELAFGGDMGCGRWDSGAVRCWGRAARGGWLRARAAATEVTGLRNVTDLAVNAHHACAIAEGRVWCWGEVSWLRGRAARRRAPHPVPAFEGRTARTLAAYGGAMAVAAGGEVWRLDTFGAPRPVGLHAVGATGDVTSLALAERGGCASLSSGAVWCWEDDGNGDPDSVWRAPELEGRGTLTPAGREVCAARRGAPFWCGGVPYGRAYRQEVWGVGATSWRDAVAVSRGCAVGRDRVVRCNHGDLRAPLGAAGDAVGEVVAVDSTPSEWSSREVDPCVLGSTGRVACARYERPFEVVSALSDVVQTRGGGAFGCALRRDGRVLCWGEDAGGVLSAAVADRAPLLVPLTR